MKCFTCVFTDHHCHNKRLRLLYERQASRTSTEGPQVESTASISTRLPVNDTTSLPTDGTTSETRRKMAPTMQSPSMIKMHPSSTALVILSRDLEQLIDDHDDLRGTAAQISNDLSTVLK